MSAEPPSARPPRPGTFRSVVRAVLVASAAAGAGGCARPLATVSGRVFLQDRPVAGGSVVFYCEGKQIVRGQIHPDGSYAIPNVPQGEVRVAVVQHTRLPDGMGKRYAMPPMIDGPVTPAPGRPEKEPAAPAIPKRYSMPEESGLTLTVAADATDFDIRLGR